MCGEHCDRGVSSLRKFFTIAVQFVPSGESNVVIPEDLGSPGFCTDEVQNTTGKVGSES